MTNKASGRSVALLATVLVLGFAGTSHAATSSLWPQVSTLPAASTDALPRADVPMVASDQLNAVDRALAETSQSAVTAPTSQPDTQSQNVVPVVTSREEGSDTISLIGKIFIGFGTLLTLGSSAARMLMG